jgi:predicted enzyme related to lactoylglutathione lyase
MVKVNDLEQARDFYRDRLGMTELWRDDSEPAIGMGFPESDAEIVLHLMDLPAGINVHYLVDDVERSVRELRVQGVRIVEEPFNIPIGKCAVLSDPFGNRLSILDMSKGPR